MRSIFIFVFLFFLATSGNATTYIVTNINSVGSGSFEQAFINATLRPGADTILFNIPGTGPFKIYGNTDTYLIDDSLFIDGLSQPGNSANSSHLGFNNAFVIRHSAVHIRGLGFIRTRGNFLEFDCSLNDTIVDVTISDSFFDLGISYTGIHVSFSNHGFYNDITIHNNLFRGKKHATGVHIRQSSRRFSTTIGSIILDTNIFSGCSGINYDQRGDSGIQNKVDSLVIKNNLFNGDWEGYEGIAIILGSGRLQRDGKGVIHVQGNVISNRFIGIKVSFGSEDTVASSYNEVLIDNNTLANCSYRGIDVNLLGLNTCSVDKFEIRKNSIRSAGTHGININFSPRGNNAPRIKDVIISENNIQLNNIGIAIYLNGSCTRAWSLMSFGNSYIEKNTIHHNYNEGIRFINSGGVSFQAPNYEGILITKNSIYQNGALGIYVRDNYFGNGLGSAFVPPTILSANKVDTNYVVKGRLINSLPFHTFDIEFFMSPQNDPSGYGEGEHYLGTIQVSTDGLGNCDFTFNTNADLLNMFISATSIQISKGNTSEFGNAYYIRTVSNDRFSARDIKLGPIPADDFIFIKWDQSKIKHIRLISASGETQYSQKLNQGIQSLTIPINHLSPGIYFTEIKDDLGNISTISWIKIDK